MKPRKGKLSSDDKLRQVESYSEKKKDDEKQEELRPISKPGHVDWQEFHVKHKHHKFEKR